MRVLQVMLIAGLIYAGTARQALWADYALSDFTDEITNLKVGTEYAGTHSYDLKHHSITETRTGVNAGNFHDNILNNPDVLSGADVKLFFMYCIDLTHTINLNTSYDAEINLDGFVTNHLASGTTGSGAITTTPTSGVLAKAGEIGYLMKNVASTLYSAAPGFPGVDTLDPQQVGLQAAIWKLVYGDNFIMKTSGYTDTSVNAYNDYLGLVSTGDFSDYINDVLWINVKNKSNGVYRQAQVGYILGMETTDIDEVPVPTTLTMLFSLVGTGLLGRFGKRYFKRNQVAA
ncbi:MAG: hypothetical protein WEB58_21090 [Planctomycetaceae bacterium]